MGVGWVLKYNHRACIFCLFVSPFSFCMHTPPVSLNSLIASILRTPYSGVEPDLLASLIRFSQIFRLTGLVNVKLQREPLPAVVFWEIIDEQSDSRAVLVIIVNSSLRLIAALLYSWLFSVEDVVARFNWV